MRKLIKVKNKIIGKNHKPFIIAEIGINHGGNYKVCEEMTYKAIESGADAIKLQTVFVEESYEKGSPSYIEFKNKQLNFNQIKKIKSICDKKNVILFSSPGGLKSLRLMIKLKLPLIKISSSQMTNLSLVKKSLIYKKPLIISTGMSFQNEIDNLLLHFTTKQLEKTILLKCISLYPSPDTTINLNSLEEMTKRYNKCIIGYSDHSLDDLSSILAVSMGASVIEKHFTTDRNLPGGDNALSMEPNEFKKMIKQIKRVGKIKGKYKIYPNSLELKKRNISRRKIFSSKNIKKGTKIKESHLIFKRPINNKIGISAFDYENLIGKKTKMNIKKDTILIKGHFEKN